MNRGNLIGKIVLIALGVILVALSARGLMDIPLYQEVLGNAVCLEEAVVLPENEGKMVIIHGKPEMIAPVYDEEIGITINAFKAYRYAEEYKQTSSEKQEHKYNWVSRGSKSILGQASLGEFNLDEKTLTGFPADKEYEDFDYDEISINGYSTGYGKTSEGAITERLWVIVGGTYYYDAFEYSDSLDIPYFTRSANQTIAEERNGAKAYAYKVNDGTDSEEVTIAGIQQGNMLVAHDRLGAVLHSGIVTQDKLVSSQTGALIGGSVAFFVLGLVLIFIGLRLGRKNNNQKKAA